MYNYYKIFLTFWDQIPKNIFTKLNKIQLQDRLHLKQTYSEFSL